MSNLIETFFLKLVVLFGTLLEYSYLFCAKYSDKFLTPNIRTIDVLVEGDITTLRLYNSFELYYYKLLDGSSQVHNFKSFLNKIDRDYKQYLETTVIVTGSGLFKLEESDETLKYVRL